MKFANSVRFVLPRITAPAARRRATSGASSSGIECWSATEPAVVGRPATSMLSLTQHRAGRAAARARSGGALGVARGGVGERLRVDDPHGVDRRPLGVRARDPRQVGLRQIDRGQRAGGRSAAPGCAPTRSRARTAGSARRRSAEQLDARRARAAAGERGRRRRPRAAVQARDDLARRPAQLRRLLVRVAEGEQPRLAVGGAVEGDVDRAAVARGVAGGHGELRVAGARADAGQRARRRHDRLEVVGRIGGAARVGGVERGAGRVLAVRQVRQVRRRCRPSPG